MNSVKMTLKTFNSIPESNQVIMKAHTWTLILSVNKGMLNLLEVSFHSTFFDCPVSLTKCY